jgi:hypothetical protein
MHKKMATVIPHIPSDYHGSPGEEEAILALRHLPQEFYVFHSLRWLGLTQHETQGEADILIFHPQKGYLVVEIKSGGIRCQEGLWFQRNRQTGTEKPIADPMAQSERSRFALLRRLEPFLPQGESCLHGHAVWFTSILRKDLRLPPNYAPEVTLDLKDLESPLAAIQRAFNFWGTKRAYAGNHRLTPSGVRSLIQAFAPAFDAAPPLRATIEERDAAMVRLTSDQTRILDFLQSQPTAAICGAAGTGKTFIAWAKAERLAAKGDKVLFLCYNSALKDFLRSRNIAPSLEVHSFHSLARKTLRIPDGSDFTASAFADLESRFLEHLASRELPYDHILIDEAQDFQDSWLSALQDNHLAKGFFYAFFDRNQLINQDEFPATLDRLPCRLTLDTNCRNTRQVAATSLSFLTQTNIQTLRSVAGPQTSIHQLSAPTDWPAKMQGVLRNLIKKQAFQPEEIAILAFDAQSVRTLKASPLLKQLPLSDTIQTGSICCTTIRKFKGLEAKAIILLDASPERLQSEDGTIAFYVGASRAMHQLHIFFTASEDELPDFMTWACDKHDRLLKKTSKGLEKLFHATLQT